MITIAEGFYDETIMTEIGDVLYATTVVQTRSAKVKFNRFDVEGDNLDSLSIYYRISNDTINWSDWFQIENLNNSNNIDIEYLTNNGTVYIQTRFEVINQPTPVELYNFKYTGNSISTPYFFHTFSEHLSRTYLSRYNQANVLKAELCVNLLEKIKSDKILPTFIDKLDNEDFNAFWGSIICFFATVVSYSYVFQQIILERDLLKELITQFDLFVCDKNATLFQLQNLSKDLLAEFGKRGTKNIFINDKNYKGELIRLFCLDDCDEFLWGITNKYNHAFLINNNSMLYRGTRQDDLLRKHFSKKFDSGEYLRYGEEISENNTNFEIEFYGEECSSGIGFSNEVNYNLAHIIVDPRQSYEIRFTLKALVNHVNVKLGVDVFDCFSNIYQISPSNEFGDIKIWKKQKKIIVSAIIYGINENIAVQKLNTNSGQNLKFNNDRIKAIYPKLCVQSASQNGAVLKLYGIEIRPLNYKRNKAFINNSNFIDIFVSNNANIETQKIRDIIAEKLIPYNSSIYINEIK